jgi:hypothetical protein
MHIYTLRKPMDGDKAILNGKLLLLRIGKGDGRLKIADALTKEDLWLTTPVVINRGGNEGVHFVTESGTVYDFINVESLIPTRQIVPTATTEMAHAEDPVVDFTVVSCGQSHKQIHYGDGYDKFTFEFSREIDEFEFVAFLKQEGYRITKQEYPYQDYSKVDGKGTNWTYTWVRCYTD